jgi:hypothetical protein
VVADAAFGYGPFGTVPASGWVPLADSQGTRVLEASWSLGRDDELEHYPAGTATLLLRNRDRYLDPDNAASPFTGDLLPLVPVRIRSTGPASALNVLAAAGLTASTPDRSTFAVTDLDVRIRLAMNDWTPGGFGIFLVSQYASGNVAWAFTVSAVGNLQLSYSTDGTAVTTDAGSIPGFGDGTDHWVRATLDVNNGAAGRDVKFYTSTDGITWTQLGSTITTAGTITLFNSTAPLIVNDVLPFAGKVRWAEVRNGIDGTVVANPDFTVQTPGCTGFVDATGNTWAVNGTAQIATDPAIDVTIDEFYGFVRDGWKVELAPQGANDCSIELVDLLGVMAGYVLPDVFEHTVLSYNPVGFWVLNESTAEQVADQSSGRNDGMLSGEGISLGDRVIFPGHDPAALFDVEVDTATEQNTYGYIDMGRSPIIPVGSTSSALFMATFQVRTIPAANTLRVLFVQSNGNLFAYGLGMQCHVHNNGQLVYGVDSVISARSGVSVVDGNPHVVFGAGETIGLDTATLSLPASGSDAIVKVNGVAIGGGPGLPPKWHFDGWIGVVALFASATTVGVAGRQAILDAHTKLDGQRSDQHVAWALDRLGVPASLRNLDVGTVLMGPADTKGKDALQWMRDVTVTEGGSLYIDHRDGGKVRFAHRYNRFLNPRSTVSQATFSDTAGAAGVIRYPAEGFDLASNGLDGIVNQASVSWAGGEVTVDDLTSIAAYGPRPRTVETIAITPGQARSTAEWLIARYKNPRSRIRGCIASDRSTRHRNDDVQALRVDDRVTFKVQPGKIGTQTSVDLFVDGISHHATGVEWETAFRFAPVDTFTPWVWGTGAWGTTAYWG